MPRIPLVPGTCPSFTCLCPGLRENITSLALAIGLLAWLAAAGPLGVIWSLVGSGLFFLGFLADLGVLDTRVTLVPLSSADKSTPAPWDLKDFLLVDDELVFSSGLVRFVDFETDFPLRGFSDELISPLTENLADFLRTTGLSSFWESLSFAAALLPLCGVIVGSSTAHWDRLFDGRETVWNWSPFSWSPAPPVLVLLLLRDEKSDESFRAESFWLTFSSDTLRLPFDSLPFCATSSTRRDLLLDWIGNFFSVKVNFFASRWSPQLLFPEADFLGDLLTPCDRVPSEADFANISVFFAWTFDVSWLNVFSQSKLLKVLCFSFWTLGRSWLAIFPLGEDLLSFNKRFFSNAADFFLVTWLFPFGTFGGSVLAVVDLLDRLTMGLTSFPDTSLVPRWSRTSLVWLLFSSANSEASSSGFPFLTAFDSSFSVASMVFSKSECVLGVGIFRTVISIPAAAAEGFVETEERSFFSATEQSSGDFSSIEVSLRSKTVSRTWLPSSDLSSSRQIVSLSLLCCEISDEAKRSMTPTSSVGSSFDSIDPSWSLTDISSATDWISVPLLDSSLIFEFLSASVDEIFARVSLLLIGESLGICSLVSLGFLFDVRYLSYFLDFMISCSTTEHGLTDGCPLCNCAHTSIPGTAASLSTKIE